MRSNVIGVTAPTIPELPTGGWGCNIERGNKPAPSTLDGLDGIHVKRRALPGVGQHPQANTSIPPVVRACYPDLTTDPIVTADVVPGRGWRRYHWRTRITVARARSQRTRERVTAMCLLFGTGRGLHRADFTTSELIRR